MSSADLGVSSIPVARHIYDIVGWVPSRQCPDAGECSQASTRGKPGKVVVELLEPGMGKVMGSIPDVNFVEGMNQKESLEESIEDMLKEL